MLNGNPEKREKMAEWYEIDDEVGANEVGANEIGANANEVGANAVGANANEVGAEEQYRCDCGCNLYFKQYEDGFNIYVGNNWILTACAMVKYSWGDYIRQNYFQMMNELREDIIVNYNHSLNNDPVKPEDTPWIHLYNMAVLNDYIPVNEKLYYD